MTKPTYNPKPCSHPGCTAMGEVHFHKDDVWLCHAHVHERLHGPIMALTADEEAMAIHLEEGGKLQ